MTATEAARQAREQRIQSLTGSGFWDDQGMSREAAEAQVDRETSQPYDGRVKVGDQYMTVEQVRELAQRNGWADPTAFSTDNIQVGRHKTRRDEEQPETLSMINASGWRSNNGESTVTRVAPTYSNAETGDGTPITQGGYSATAGEVRGAKRYTRAKYRYDNSGNLIGVNFEADSKWYEDAAPLLQIGLMAAGAGGLLSSVGAGVNSALNLGLGNTGQAILGGAVTGGGVAGLTGQNVLKGAALGAVGPAINAANPGASFASSAAGQAAVNKGLTMAVKGAVRGKSPNPVSIATGLMDAGGWR